MTQIADMGYEEARDALVEVVRKLEAGGATLEESLALWERGEQLADLCQAWLTGATSRLDEAIARHDAAADGTAAGREAR
jgi:exodeoxyribonuclease VII small subunit